ncbi:integral membrane protein [Nemania sp. FL0916]|nr:integral membrane protein [Nemania sp. FL0916]
MEELKHDLPMAMTMAAFAGISWYIGAELNLSLFLFFKRRRGLYFWACALGSWGVITQSLFIILADFGVWTDLKGSITFIYLSWILMVVPQSWVLYSRLYLLMQHDNLLRWVRAALIFTTIVFGFTTIPLGILTQAVMPSLAPVNAVWDRLQTTVFFVQETILSAMYIWQTRKYLHDMSPLLDNMQSRASLDSAATRANKTSKTRTLLQHLLYINLLIISLDIALLGVQYADLFYIQGAFKPAIYGVKLKLEFVILNRLIKSISRRAGVGSAAHVTSDIRRVSDSEQAFDLSLQSHGWSTHRWPSSGTDDSRQLKTPPHIAAQQRQNSVEEDLGDMRPIHGV